MTGSLREVKGGAVRASPVAKPGPSARRGLVIATVGGVFMALIGALGSGEVPLLPRLAYWLVVMWSGAALGFGVAFGVHRWGRLRAWPLVEGALIALAIALPLTTIVIVANHLTFGGGFPAPEGMISAFLVVLLISGLITVVNYTTAPAVVMTPVSEAVAAPPLTAPRFLDRLPLRLRHARLLAIEAEDHYLRVHTDAGSDLVLLRMVDAVAELDGLAGARTHRSWWVARDAVVGVESSGGRTTLTLSGGLTVPVSRGARPDLTAQGWFA